ncbi:hypothetical protein [Paraburkholderia youngii]|uniref:Uncharacterized protein n=1 Tax=Paraburkholderia youngii TaxID=2782701 RepID=A0A7Y6K4H1_9BURK|nr:hypothetical protein [Paraburkholderia youngii]NUY04222.1 hypothetical protein [Paraburkholderia youngii]
MAAYGFIVSERGRDLVIAGVAVIHWVFLLFAGGLKFILLSAVPYVLATALYVWADREQGKPVFITSDWIIFVVVMIGASLESMVSRQEGS